MEKLAGVISFYGVVTAPLPDRGTPLEQASHIHVPVLARKLPLSTS
jgi:hypothetical protein